MSKSEYAYVFAMYVNDGYLLGALVLAYSIFKTNTKYDVVCMVTPDVSEDAKSKMKHIGIRVVDIEYLYFDLYHTKPFLIKKNYSSYESFNTKWTCLNLTEYKKVFVFDINMIVQQNIDHVFKLPAPATRLFLHVSTLTSQKQSGFYASILIADGEKLPTDIADTFINNKGGGIVGGCVLLKPSANKFKKFTKYLKKFNIRKLNHTMARNEISLFSFYVHLQKQWCYLGPMWSCMKWKYNEECFLEDSLIINYAGNQKPWTVDFSKNPDLKKWYQFYNEMKNEYPQLMSYKF